MGKSGFLTVFGNIGRCSYVGLVRPHDNKSLKMRVLKGGQM